MSEGSVDFKTHIASVASDYLLPSKRGFEYVAQEQGGIIPNEALYRTLSVNERISSLVGLGKLTAGLRNVLFQQAANDLLEDSSKHSPDKAPIKNQFDFMGDMLGDTPKVARQLAESEAKLLALEQSLQGVRGATDPLKDKAAAWRQTVQEISHNLLDQTDYQRMVDEQKAQLEVKHNGRSYKDKLGDIVSAGGDKKIEVLLSRSSLPAELAERMIDEYLETAFTLNAVRVLDRIQRPLDVRAKYRKLLACLDNKESDNAYSQLIETTGLAEKYTELKTKRSKIIQERLSTSDERAAQVVALELEFQKACEPELTKFFNPEGDTDETIDLLKSKRDLVQIEAKVRAIKSSDLSEEDKQSQLVILDGQVRDILVPIANKIERVFPHVDSTNLIQVLENEEGICAGKVNAFLAVLKYLGVRSRALSIKEIMDNGNGGHVTTECDLPSGEKLIVDSNFSNKSGLDQKTDDELVQTIKDRNPDISILNIDATLKGYKRAIANSASIVRNSRVLLYQAESTGEVIESDFRLNEVRELPNLFVRIDPYTGKRIVWKADVPYPHLITAPDKDGYMFINSSFCGNNSIFIRKGYEDIQRYLITKELAMAPWAARTHKHYLELLSRDEGIAYLVKIKDSMPSVYYDGLNLELAGRYVYAGKINDALAVFEDLKKRDEHFYYRNTHLIVSSFLPISIDSRNDLKVLARQIFDEAIAHDPKLFYGEPNNVSKMLRVFRDDPESKIEALEQFEEIDPEKFWARGSTDYRLTLGDVLLEEYQAKAHKLPEARDQVIAFLQRSKYHSTDFYIDHLTILAKEVVSRNEADIPDAIKILEDFRSENASAFYTDMEKVGYLGKLYAWDNREGEALRLYQELRDQNPNKFWSGGFESGYYQYAKLLDGLGQTTQAIKVVEEAMRRSSEFWEQTYGGDYSQLVDLYRKEWDLDKAISCLLEARSKDERFDNPKINSRGYILLADIYRDSGDYDMAIKTLVEGSDTDAHYWEDDGFYRQPNVIKLVDVLKDSGKVREAVGVLQELRQRSPDNYWKTDYFEIALLLDRIGESTMAGEIRTELIGKYEDLKTSDPKMYENKLIYDKLARLYAGAGDRKKAISILTEFKSVSKFDFYIPTQFFLVDCYLQVGDKKMATQEYKELIDRLGQYGATKRIAALRQKAATEGIIL